MVPDLFLVKNLLNDRVVFYWVNKKGKRVSPVQHTQPHAEDWWKTFVFSCYEGMERRKTIMDRRKCFKTRSIMDQRNKVATDPVGRRYTDHPIKISFNIYEKKIKEFVTSLH